MITKLVQHPEDVPYIGIYAQDIANVRTQQGLPQGAYVSRYRYGFTCDDQWNPEG